MGLQTVSCSHPPPLSSWTNWAEREGVTLTHRVGRCPNPPGVGVTLVTLRSLIPGMASSGGASKHCEAGGAAALRGSDSSDSVRFRWGRDE